MPNVIIQTPRLTIRKSEISDQDVDLFLNLWNNPEVMKFVGFPRGLNITREKITDIIKTEDKSEFDCKLIVVEKETNTAIGECKLGNPDKEGISETDVKLLPEYWGQGYGTEIKKALVDYLFNNTNCSAVMGSPNKLNLASQKMQEAVGGKRVAEDVYVFPEKMKSFTQDVHCYIYMVFREDWKIAKGNKN